MPLTSFPSSMVWFTLLFFCNNAYMTLDRGRLNRLFRVSYDCGYNILFYFDRPQEMHKNANEGQGSSPAKIKYIRELV